MIAISTYLVKYNYVEFIGMWNSLGICKIIKMAWVPIVKAPGENPTQRQVLNCRLDKEKGWCV